MKCEPCSNIELRGNYRGYSIRNEKIIDIQVGFLESLQFKKTNEVAQHLEE